MHIDWWTLAFQTVNVLVLIWILGRFFFRPVADIVAKRQEEANKLLADAAAARQQAADARADADKVRAENRRRAGPTDRRSAASQHRRRRKICSRSRRRRSRSSAARPKRRSLRTEWQRNRRSSLVRVNFPWKLRSACSDAFHQTIALSAFLDGLCQELRALSSEARRELHVGDGGRSCHRGRDRSAAFQGARWGTFVMRSKRRSVRNCLRVSRRSGLNCRHRAAQPPHYRAQ